MYFFTSPHPPADREGARPANRPDCEAFADAGVDVTLWQRGASTRPNYAPSATFGRTTASSAISPAPPALPRPDPARAGSRGSAGAAALSHPVMDVHAGGADRGLSPPDDVSTAATSSSSLRQPDQAEARLAYEAHTLAQGRGSRAMHVVSSGGRPVFALTRKWPTTWAKLVSLRLALMRSASTSPMTASGASACPRPRSGRGAAADWLAAGRFYRRLRGPLADDAMDKGVACWLSVAQVQNCSLALVGGPDAKAGNFAAAGSNWAG